MSDQYFDVGREIRCRLSTNGQATYQATRGWTGEQVQRAVEQQIEILAARERLLRDWLRVYVAGRSGADV